MSLNAWCVICVQTAVDRLDIDRELLREQGFPVERLDQGGIIYEAVGCEACLGSGYRGRSGIFEILPIDDDIRPLIIAHASASDIKQQAIAQGMKTLREDGWEKVLNGTTTIDEILRVTEEAEIID